MTQTRVCKKCKKEKPIDEFYSCYASKGYYRRECKQCTLKAQKHYALEHKEEKAEYLKNITKKIKKKFVEFHKKGIMKD